MSKWTFLLFCCSRWGGVSKLKNRVLTLRAVHFLFCLAPSSRATVLLFATPLVRYCSFCVCSLQMCCWRSGFSPSAWIRNSSNSCLQIRMVNHVRSSYFSRARDFTAQCLCHPSPSNLSFAFTVIVLTQKWASRIGGVEKIKFVALDLVAVHIFLLLPLSPRLPNIVFSTPPLWYCLNNTVRNVWRAWLSHVAKSTRVFR